MTEHKHPKYSLITSREIAHNKVHQYDSQRITRNKKYLKPSLLVKGNSGDFAKT